MSVGRLCEAAGMSRQNYYKRRRVRRREQIDEELIVELVRRERQLQPKLGVRKLLCRIRPHLEVAGVGIGRDRLFKLLSRHDLLIQRRRRATMTTDSRHGFARYANVAKELTLSAAHQLLVCDITYLRTMDRFMYLALVMDAFSRKIVGYDCSDSLEVVGALRALSMALEQLPAGAETMHHSDQGVQYCCRAYVERLKAAGLTISMTEQNHCYENAKAERLNGTLKRELMLETTFLEPEHAVRAVREAVATYNHHRPHMALDFCVPSEVHGQSPLIEVA